MANTNTLPARQARRRKTISKANVEELLARVWQAVETAVEIMEDGSLPADLRLRAVHGVTQASASALKLIEAGEWELRIRNLESEVLE